MSWIAKSTQRTFFRACGRFRGFHERIRETYQEGGSILGQERFVKSLRPRYHTVNPKYFSTKSCIQNRNRTPKAIFGSISASSCEKYRAGGSTPPDRGISTGQSFNASVADELSALLFDVHDLSTRSVVNVGETLRLAGWNHNVVQRYVIEFLLHET